MCCSHVPMPCDDRTGVQHCYALLTSPDYHGEHFFYCAVIRPCLQHCECKAVAIVNTRLRDSGRISSTFWSCANILLVDSQMHFVLLYLNDHSSCHILPSPCNAILVLPSQHATCTSYSFSECVCMSWERSNMAMTHV